MFDLIILAAAVAQLATPQPKTPIITFNDYPSSAASGGEQGAVIFSLLVDPAGKPLKCQVDAIQGHDFGALVCNKAMRARFTPASDRSGAPIHGIFHNAMSFWLPGEKGSENYPYKTGPDLAIVLKPEALAQLTQQEVAVVVQFDADGKPVDCGPGARQAGNGQVEQACKTTVASLAGKAIAPAPVPAAPYVAAFKVAFIAQKTAP